MKRTLLTMIAVLAPLLLPAQSWSASVNTIDYLNFGTIGAEASAAVSRHFTVNASAKVNPWTFHRGDPDIQMQNRHQTYALGARWWPWNVYSGWWVSCYAQYQEYNRGGIFRRRTEEGDAFGMGLSAGWSLMLHSNINLDLGLGFWGGRKIYTEYECPWCGRVTDTGAKWFLMPNELIVALLFTF